MESFYAIAKNNTAGSMLVKDGLSLVRQETLGRHDVPKESEAIAQFNEGIKRFSLIHYYWETEMADSDSRLDRVIKREDAVPLTSDNAVFEKGKLVGFFYKIPDTFRLKGQSHLFLFADPSTHKRIIDSTEKYELRKK